MALFVTGDSESPMTLKGGVMKQIFRRPTLKALTLVLLVVSLPTLASASDGTKERDAVRSYQHRADMLKQTDAKQYASELTSISNWIEEALVLIGKEEVEKVQTLNEKIAVHLDYVEAGLQRDVVVGNAEQSKKKLDELKATQGKLAAEIQQLKAREAKLQADMKKTKR